MLLRSAVAAAYVIAALLAFRAGRNAPARERVLWLSASAMLLVFGIAKQLQLQDAVTGAARQALEAAGWYDRHQEAQWLFALALAVATLALGMVLLSRLRGSTGSVKTAALVLTFLTAFVLVRAASFHTLDAWLTHEVLGMRLGWWVELVAITAIALSAVADLRTRTRSL